MRNQILLGDCLDVLKTLPDASVDSCVADPPYGLGTREPTGDEIIAYLQGAELDTNGDFMGARWQVPPVAVWCEVFRVLKPGGHLLCFGGTRTFDLISIGIRAAGFECRDTIASQFGVQVLQAIHGQGFPKAKNVAKDLQKIGLSEDEISRWAGWHSSLKPSWEPVMVFRRPLAEPTIAKQVLATGTGALNIDGCRVSIDAHDPNHRPGVTQTVAETTSMFGVGGQRRGSLGAGRWPANLLLTHSNSCRRTGTNRVPAPVINRFDDGMKPFGDGAGHEYTSVKTGDADGMEAIPVYECADGCPVMVLDEQSGALKSGGGDKGNRTDAMGSYSGGELRYVPQPYEANTGGASRFFSQFEPDAPFLYAPKVSKSERDRGLPKGTNMHPTVKPQTLMRWMVRLVTPKGGTVLDPYCGSGSTLVAATKEGMGFIGIERDPEFHRVAELRVKAELAAQTNIMDELAEL